jgi:multicomponent Na+:H+ antiporter subunit G
MTDFFITFFSISGAVFILIAAIGMLRMPDFYLRTSVTTKAVTLGVGLMLVAAALHFQNINVTSRVLAIVVFIILTAPVAAHMVGRAAYFTGVKMWKNSVMDDLEGKYHKGSHYLKGEEAPEANPNKTTPE